MADGVGRSGRPGRRPVAVALDSGLVVQVHDTGPPQVPTPTGNAVLLLHGIGMTASSLEPVARALSTTHRAVRLTLPGHGGSPRPRRPLSVEDYAEAASDTADRLGLDRVVVLGQSMGAQFAVALARLRPDLVAGLVLVGPVVDDAHPTAVAQGLALSLDSTRESVRGNLLVVRDYVRCGPVWFTSTLRAMLSYPTREKASGLTVPTIVVRGAGDPIAGPEWVRRLAASMGDARVATLPGAHHTQLVVPRDVADLVRRVDGRSAAPRQGPAHGSETEKHGDLTIHERRSNA